MEQPCIGIARYGSLGDVSPRLPAVKFNFSGHFRSAQTLNTAAYPEISLQAYSFVTVYCTNFIMFSCVTLKFFFSSCPSSSAKFLATPLQLLLGYVGSLENWRWVDISKISSYIGDTDTDIFGIASNIIGIADISS